MAEFHDVVSRPPSRINPLDEQPSIEGNGGGWDDTPDYRDAVRKPVSSVQSDEGDLSTAGFSTIGRGRIKVDLETPLEHLFMWGIIIGGIGLVIVLFNVLFDSKHPMNPTTRNSLLSLLGSLFASSIALYRATDNYYVVDLNRRALNYHFRLLFWEWESIYVEFGEFLGITANGQKKKSKHSTWWDYQTMVVLKNGSRFPVSDELKENLLDANLKARTLAKLVGCPYHQGRHESHLTVERDPNSGKYRIFHSEPSWFSGNETAIIVLVIFFVLMPLIIFLAGR